MANNKELINSEITNSEESFTKPLAVNESFNKDINITINNPQFEDTKDINNKNTNLKEVKNVEKEKNKEQYEPHNITRISVKSHYKIYVPFVTIKILIPTYFMYKYLIYGIKNKEDQNYCKYAICIFHFYVLF